MVCEWIAYHPLTIDERKKIKEGLDLNMSYREIASHVGRVKSVVIREAKRLGNAKNYDPVEAQKDFENKQKLIRKKK